MTDIWRFGNSDDPEISVCVPTLDLKRNRVWLRPTWQALEEYTKHLDYEVVVVNCEGELLGYTSPQNQAMAAGAGEYLIAMNDDVVVAPGWIDPLIRALCADGVWCATPDNHWDGPQVFAPYCMAWHRDSWQEIGGLDEQFVLWCSDIDLARRLVDAGYPPVKCMLPYPIRHELNATSRRYPQELNPVCIEDMARFQQKWGTSAEDEKHRLAALVA